jgi:hypothetical protein
MLYLRASFFPKAAVPSTAYSRSATHLSLRDHVYLILCHDSSAKGLQKQHFLNGQEGLFTTTQMVEVNQNSVILSTLY